MNYIELKVDRRVVAGLLLIVALVGAYKIGYRFGYRTAMQEAYEAVQEIIANVQKGQGSQSNDKLHGV